MATRLDEIVRATDARSVPILSLELARIFSRELQSATNAEDIIELRIRIAVELMNGGATKAAIEKFEEIERDYSSKLVGTKTWATVRHAHAVAWLRLGEQENCLEEHTSASCILPIQMDGVHKKPAVIEGPDGDIIAIRPIGVLAQTFDHRAVDGAYSAAFLRELKTTIETRDWMQALSA